MANDELAVDASQIVDVLNARKKLKQSVTWLVRHSSELAGYRSIEDWAYENDADGPVGYHMIQVRAELASAIHADHGPGCPKQ